MSGNVSELLDILESDHFLYEMMKGCPYEILRQIKIQHYAPGKFHLHQGNIYDIFYIIVRGSAEIYVESDGGKRYHLSTYGKGRFIGEMEIFRRAPYVSSVASKEEIVLMEIARDLFLRWVDKDKNFAGILLSGISGESYNMCQNMAENTLYSLKQRVGRYLLQNTDCEGHFYTGASTENLGEMLAVTQRSVNRILKELRDKRLISIDRKGLHIPDRESLSREIEM